MHPRPANEIEGTVLYDPAYLPIRKTNAIPALQVGLMCAPPQRAQLVWSAQIAADLTALRRDDFKPIRSGRVIGSRALLWRSEQE